MVDIETFFPLKLNYSSSQWLVPQEPDECVEEWKVTAKRGDRLVGTAKYHLISLDQHPFSLFDICDAHSQTLLDLYENVLMDWCDMQWDFDAITAAPFVHSILHLASIEIKPSWRGQGLGPAILREICRRHYDAVAILQPQPLNDPEADPAPLQRYWAKTLNVTRWKDSPYWYDAAWEIAESLYVENGPPN